MGLGRKRYPLISVSHPLPTRTLSHTGDLTAHPCRLIQITSSCQQVHREPVVHGSVRETGISVSQVLLRGTEVSLKLTCRGIMRSFRSSKEAVHTTTMRRDPNDLFADDAVSHFHEMLVYLITNAGLRKRCARGAFKPPTFSVFAFY